MAQQPNPSVGSGASPGGDDALPPDHPFRAHVAAVAAAEVADPHPSWTPADGPLPALYVSHGGGPLPLQDPTWLQPLRRWARSLPKPKAVLVVSAHWESAPIALSATEPTGLVYDFGGFDPVYHRVRYDTPGAAALAADVRAALHPPGSPTDVHQHATRGLDHGAWVPLKIMYPAGDVPVLQLSLPTDRPTELLEIGRRLRPLRDEGVLVIGSGHMTHGLPYLTAENFRGGAVPGWSTEFDAWAAEALQEGDVDELARYRTSAPGMPYAHPTVEHFTPLFVTLGAASEAGGEVTTRLDGYALGLSRRSVEAA